VVAETISLFLRKGTSSSNKVQIEFFKKNILIGNNSIEQEFFNKAYDNIFNINLSNNDISLLSKIESGTTRLFELVNINNGVVTGNDKKFISSKKSKEYNKVCVTGKNIRKYYVSGIKGYLNYDREKLLRARNQEIFEAKEKLIMQMININLVLAYDNKKLYNLGTTYAITLKNNSIDLKYILGLLNSKLMNYYYKKKFTNESSLTNAISTKNLFEFPIKLFNNTIQNNMVKLVDNLLKLNKQLQDTKLENQRQQIQHTIDYSEKKIDELVYGLYGLNEEEIEIINKT